MKDEIKLVIVLSLNTILFVSSVADLISTETQIVSTVILLIMYYCWLAIDD